jgi:hypothetical protein
MKKSTAWIILSLGMTVCSLIFIAGCRKNTVGPHTITYTYTIYTPIYKLKQSVLDSVNGDPGKTIDSLGKIYFKDNFIFLNDVDKGIHVIDNSDPSHPVQVAFLNIPGNQDIAIKGNTLYADMYADLLVIDLSNIHHVQISTMMGGLFPDREYVNGFNMDSNTVIVNWIKKDTTVTAISNGYPGMGYLNNAGGLAVPASFAQSSNAASTTGVAGSTAKMVLINNYLYAITERHMLGTIDLTQPKSPSLVSNIFAGFDLETIFPFQDKLFLGSDIGTFMYDISNPASPTQIGEFKHGQACDPVITDGIDAYITLHAGTSCGGASNELDVVNVQNLANPYLVKSYPMISPTGLGKDGNLLFVCDGPNNVKLFDATQPDQLWQFSVLNIPGPYDVIAANKILMVVATKGLYQYDYSNVSNIRLLSFYPVK